MILLIQIFLLDLHFDILPRLKFVGILAKNLVKVENNELYIATCPTSINLDINSKNDINNDDWYILNSFGDYVLTIPTTLSIAESIEQYVGKKYYY